MIAFIGKCKEKCFLFLKQSKIRNLCKKCIYLLNSIREESPFILNPTICNLFPRWFMLYLEGTVKGVLAYFKLKESKVEKVILFSISI